MNENPTLKFELTLSEANSIIMALMEIPAKIANPLMEKIANQGKAQLEPKDPIPDLPEVTV